MARDVTRLTTGESVAVWSGTALWTGGIIAAVVLELGAAASPEWLTGVVAALAVLGLMLVAGVVGRSALRREGVERTVGIEASALAFWVTVGGAFTYGMIDAFADLPALRAPWVVAFGLLSWAVAQATRLTRFR
ncbi:MAG TPA: hypothetical protein VES42_00255 [Pilimelia sp.]|nr:hypothetical protein [Pilimelia sp.]